jgi:inosine triphosphate pyrophosphatase
VLFSGWDPIFEYKGKTYAEMTKDEKVRILPIKKTFALLTLGQNKISHRSRALTKLQQWLAEQQA